MRTSEFIQLRLRLFKLLLERLFLRAQLVVLLLKLRYAAAKVADVRPVARDVNEHSCPNAKSRRGDRGNGGPVTPDGGHRV